MHIYNYIDNPPKKSLKGKIKLEISYFQISIYFRGTVINAQGNNSIKTNIYLDQRCGRESPKVTPGLCGEMTKHMYKRLHLSNKSCWGKLDGHMWRNGTGHFPFTVNKNHSK